MNSYTGEPITQTQVESEILRLSGLAEKVTSEIAQRAMDAAQKDSDYKAEHAKTFLEADGTDKTREATAAAKCEDFYLGRRIAEARLLAAQEAGRNYRAQLDALRSINANHRALVS